MSIEPITIPMSIEVNEVTIDSTFDARIEVVEGGSITVESLSVNTNGTTTAPTGKAYSPVVVNVPNTYTNADEGKVVKNGALASQTSTTKNANGTYDTTTNNQVTVAVPASAVDTGTKNITSNGNNQDVVGYAAVNVAVPNSYSAGDEGKVVSSGALVAQTAHADVTPTTSDQTIDTTTNNSIKVKGDADLVAGNIKKDVEIFGVTGSYEGGGGGTVEALTLTKNQTVTALQGVAYNPVKARVYGAANPTTNSLNQIANLGISELKVSFPAADSGLNSNNISSPNYAASLKKLIFDTYPAWIASDVFKNFTSLEYVINVFAALKGSFSGCTSLCGVDIGSYINPGGTTNGLTSTNAFYGCSSLNVLVLRKTAGVVTLSDTNNFDDTPFSSSGSGGTIYVPSALISAYQSATNWSTILAYPNNSIEAIEGSAYETKCVDGTPVLEINFFSP